jgi:hypothetical protein
MAISALTAVTNAIQTTSLILVTPQNTVGYQPQNQVGQPFNQPALLFHYEGENTATIESDITDHYVEDNTAIQDTIALKPVIITTQGFIGELNNVPPNTFFQAAQTAVNKLTTISAYTPTLSATALLAYNEAVFAYNNVANLAQNAISAANSITGIATGTGLPGTSVITGTGIQQQPNQTLQQRYFQQFYGYWNLRTLFTIQTPWAIFEDMAIKSMRTIQSAETNMISDFEITFKQIRYASVVNSELYLNPSNATGSRAFEQTQPQVNTGVSALNPSPVPFSSSLTTLTA